MIAFAGWTVLGTLGFLAFDVAAAAYRTAERRRRAALTAAAERMAGEFRAARIEPADRG